MPRSAMLTQGSFECHTKACIPMASLYPAAERLFVAGLLCEGTEEA